MFGESTCWFSVCSCLFCRSSCCWCGLFGHFGFWFVGVSLLSVPFWFLLSTPIFAIARVMWGRRREHYSQHLQSMFWLRSSVVWDFVWAGLDCVCVLRMPCWKHLLGPVGQSLQFFHASSAGCLLILLFSSLFGVIVVLLLLLLLLLLSSLLFLSFPLVVITDYLIKQP